MIIQCVLCLIFLMISLQIDLTNPNPPPISGPYKTTIDKIVECSKLSRPLVKDPAFIINLSINNPSSKATKFNNNITVVRNVNNVKIKLKSYLWHDGKWELNYKINNIDCHGMLLQVLTKVLTIKYDAQNCTFIKGSYINNNMDVTWMQHLMKSTMEYGRTKTFIEISVPKGILACFEIFIDIEPASIKS